MAVFLPGYTWITNSRNGGGTYATDGPSSILLHMTVSMGISAGYISSHPYPPHLWANPYNGDRFQTVSLDRSAFALYQPDYGNSWTNKKGYTLQTELVGVPQVSVATYSDEQCRWIGEQVVAPQARWLASIGKPVNLNQVRYHPETGGSASEYWSGRMGEAEWDSFNGLCAHIDVPYNDHWDCSAERLDRIAGYARAALGQTGGGTPAAPKDKDDDMLRWYQDETGTQYAGDGLKLTPLSSDYARHVLQVAGTLMTKAQMEAAGYVWNIDRGSLTAAFQIAPINEAVTDVPF